MVVRYIRGLISPAFKLFSRSISANFRYNSSSAKNSVVLFPWRERPDVYGGSSDWAFHFYRFIFRQDESDVSGLADEGEIIEGVKIAFNSCVDAIFRHPLLATVETDYGKVHSLYDVLDHKLASFFDEAIRRFSNDDNEIVYKLISYDRPIIVDNYYVIGSVRNRLKSASKRMKSIFTAGVGFCYPSEYKGKVSWDTTTELLEKGVSVRLHLDIPCKELFYLRNRKTGEVVQGSIEPQNRIHNIIIENQFQIHLFEDRPASNIGNGDWNVVDIDDWLQGNIFY